jgi:hypothetical protein
MGKQIYDIEWCHEQAKSVGWECLSEEYVNQQTKMTWKCPDGHVQERSQASFKSIIRRKGRCVYCKGKKVITLQDCKMLAKKENGKCLSTKYKNNIEKMKWLCWRNHYWEANRQSAEKIWCPECRQEMARMNFLLTIFEGIGEIYKTTEDQNLPDKDYNEKILTFLRTPEVGRQRRSRTRKMVEDVVKEHFKKRKNPYPIKSRKLLPLIIKRAVYPKIISMNDIDLISLYFSMDISMKSIQMDELRKENNIWVEKLKKLNNDEQKQTK